MRNDKLSVQSMDFTVSVINLVKMLKLQKEHIISNQIGRSGTSIGANIREAQLPMVRRILWRSFKLHGRRPMRLVTGWNCCTGRGI